jgi:hypothetical protein
MDLVFYKMLQALVEGGSKEDERVEGTTSVSIVHALVAMLLIPQLLQIIANTLHCEVVHEWSRVSFLTKKTRYFA